MKDFARSPMHEWAAGGKASRAAATAGAAFVALFVLGHISPLVNHVEFDESNLVYDASRLLAGQVIYRDFFCFLPPGGMYVMSGWPWGWLGHPETGVRFLTVAAVLTIWILAWRSLRSSAASKDFPAGPIAAIFPLCLFPYATSAPHHWMAVAWYTAAIAATARALVRRNGWRSWMLVGALVGTAGCFLQTEGLFSLTLLAFAVLLSGGMARDVLNRAAAAFGGLFAAAAVWIGPLALCGAFGALLKHVVIWSVTNYRQPGSINYRPFLVDLPDRYTGLWHFDQVGPGIPGILRAVAGSLLYAALLSFAALCLLASCWMVVRVLRTRKLPQAEVVIASVLTLLGLGVFNYSGPGWIHLVYILPPVLLLWGLVIGMKPLSARLLRWLRGGAWGMLCLGLLCHGALLTTHVPSAWEFLDVDRVDRESPLNRSLRTAPFLHTGDLIVVLPSGGNVYLYTYPSAISYTYLFPLEDGYNNLEDHHIAAHQIEANRPSAIFIHKVRLKAFLEDGGPLAEVIQRDYAAGPESPAVKVFLRRSRVS